MRRYHGVIMAAAIRVSRQWGTGSPDEIDDVVQEIYLKLYAERFQALGNFSLQQENAAFGFIKVVATNTARDFFRHKNADKRGESQTGSLSDIPERFGLSADLERRLTLVELDRLLVANTQHDNGSRDRAIFQLHYRDGMTALAISELPGIGLGQKGVEAVLHRLTKAIRAAISDAQEMGAS